jgi:2-C-methyl-D-erythritol 4-phosphate cytidylyltransferase
MKVTALIAAAGIGKRMKSETCKQLLILNKNPIIHYSIDLFEKVDLINEIVIVAHKDIIPEIKSLRVSYKYKKVVAVIEGGKERQDSIKNGIDYLSQAPPDVVLIHDAVRPFIKQDMVKGLIKASEEHSCVVPSINLKDTIKSTQDGLFFEETMDRKLFRLIQTPQVFNYKLIKDAYTNIYNSQTTFTDDSSLVEKMGVKPFNYLGDEQNIKITTPFDLKMAEFIITNL